MKIQEARDKVKRLLNLADRPGSIGEGVAARLAAEEIIRKYNIENLFESELSDEFNEKTILIEDYKNEQKNILIKLLNNVFPYPYILVNYIPNDVIQIKISSTKDNFSELLNTEVLNKLIDVLNTECIRTFTYQNRNITNNRTRRPSYKKFFCGIEIKNFKIKE